MPIHAYSCNRTYFGSRHVLECSLSNLNSLPLPWEGDLRPKHLFGDLVGLLVPDVAERMYALQDEQLRMFASRRKGGEDKRELVAELSEVVLANCIGMFEELGERAFARTLAGLSFLHQHRVK